MEYVKGKQYTFPVSEVVLKPLWGKLFYNILANGNMIRVAAMEFQRDNKPHELHCICTSADPKNLRFEQDRSVLLPQIYTPGKNYEFKVISDNPINGAYRLQDSNGWSFSVVPPPRERLMRYSVIKCKVKGISGVALNLELVEENRHQKTLFISLDKIDELCNYDRRLVELLKLRLRTDVAFASAMAEYDRGNPLWILLAFEAARDNMSEWMSLKPENANYLLQAVRTIALAVLQTSGFIDAFHPMQRDTYRKLLINIILYTENYIEAVRLVSAGKEQDYIDETLALIRQAYYIFRPEQRMHILMAIFTIKGAYVAAYIHQIFTIIKERHEYAGFMGLFRKAFIEMLNMYISNAPKFVNSSSKASVKEMMEALAMQLMLIEEHDAILQDRVGEQPDNVDINIDIYRARLYRYASMLVGNNDAANLLMHSYCLLLAPEETDMLINWKDLDNLQISALGMKSHPMADNFGMVYTSVGRNASLTLDGKNIMLKPSVKTAKKWVSAIPPNLFPDFNINISLNNKLSYKPSSIGRSLPKAVKLWEEIEESLFAHVKLVTMPDATKKQSPAIGSVVPVRVTNRQTLNHGDKNEHIYGCIIESTEFKGEGYVRRENIVKYPARIDVHHFQDADGNPYLLDAKVLGINPNGTLEFSLKELFVDTAYQQAEHLRKLNAMDRHYQDEDADCFGIVTGGDEPSANGYLCVSDLGFAFRIDKRNVAEELTKGDVIVARIHQVSYDPAVDSLYVNSDFKDFYDDDVEPLDYPRLIEEIGRSFATLVQTASRDKIYIPEEEDVEFIDKQDRPEDDLSPETLSELIAIFSRLASVYDDYFSAYNCLAFTRLIALMAGEQEEAAMLKRRMEVITAIDKFNDNGRPDSALVSALIEQGRKWRERDSDLNIKLLILSILSSLDRPITEQLAIPPVSIDDGRLNKMAKLAIAYNSLGGLDMGEQQFKLRRALYALAELEYSNKEMSGAVTVADGEDQMTEFKSSLIFPAGKNMKADKERQMAEIMQVVCGFLNSRDGGNLYIGADNFGQPIGLDNDFSWLNGKSFNFDMQVARDKFELLFRNGFYDHFGVTQGGYNLSADNVKTSFESYGKNTVYVVRIKPAENAVSLTDGSMYVRQGTSTRPIIGEENQEKYRATRNKTRSVK